ncbi:MAG: formate dehydrogenase [Betaproteobacteria bacterium]
MSEHEYPKKVPANLRRRGFLLTVGAGGAASVAVALQPLTPAIPELPSAAPEASQGYRDTQHVRDYYRTTKI